MINFYNQQNKNIQDAPSSTQNKLNGNVAKASYKKYEDPTGEFGSKELKWGIWFVKNKVLLYRLLLGFLVAFSAVTVGFSLYKVGTFVYYDLLIKPYQESEFAFGGNYSSARSQFNPAPLEILNSYYLSGGTDLFDAVADVTNPNERYIATIVYHFDFGGITTATMTEQVMPLTNRLLVVFGLNSSDYPGTPTFVIDSVSWSRVSAHTVPDVTAWQEERMNFTVNDFVYEYGGAPEGPSANVVKFDFTNESPFGYKSPLFYVGLYQSGALVGVMRFDLQDFDSLDTREIDLRNFVRNLSVSEIRVFPIIDLYDKTVYLPPKK